MKVLRSAYNLFLGSLIAATVTACADTTGPDVAMHASLTVLRTEQVQNPNGILPFTPTIAVSAGKVEITGQIRTPTPCYALESSLLSASNVITLTVTAKASNPGGVCAQVLVVRDYGAAITRIPAGRYTVRVAHIIDELRTPDIVIEKQVDVP